MRWQDERYVRLYTRNTPEWSVLPWQARGLMGLILREVDRAGILELGKLGLPAVAIAVRAPWEEIEGPLEKLIEDGCIVYRADIRLLVIPNFVEAQEASQSDKQRKRTERERARDVANAMSHDVTQPSQGVTDQSQFVTNCHTPSHGVTSSHSELSCAELSFKIPLSPEGDGGAVQTVFQHWLKVLAHLKFKRTPSLTSERRRLIALRLKDFTAEELCRAIDGVRRSPHFCGENDRGEVYVDFETIFRNRTKVEGHIARAETNGTRAPDLDARDLATQQAQLFRLHAGEKTQ